jgi:hypothetical protein
MTPALLPGFHAFVHTETQQACIVQSATPGDYVQGMLIFGQGREARNHIHQHYRPSAKRVKVQVEVDFLVPDATSSSWLIQRKRIWASSWLWANPRSTELHFRNTFPGGWTIEAYLSGALVRSRAMRIGYDGSIGDDYNCDGSEDEEGREEQPGNPKEGPQAEQREVVRGGSGTLDYERSEAAIGWW